MKEDEEGRDRPKRPTTNEDVTMIRNMKKYQERM